MVDVNTHFYGALVALAIVCILSILGSFITWMNSFDSPEMIDNRHRWKWMVIVFMIVFIFMLLGVKPNVT
jgi:phosphatidylglycerophosphate synthase